MRTIFLNTTVKDGHRILGVLRREYAAITNTRWYRQYPIRQAGRLYATYFEIVRRAEVVDQMMEFIVDQS